MLPVVVASSARFAEQAGKRGNGLDQQRVDAGSLIASAAAVALSDRAAELAWAASEPIRQEASNAIECLDRSGQPVIFSAVAATAAARWCPGKEARVYQLAVEFGVPSKVIMAKLQEMGEFIRSASSTVDHLAVYQFRQQFAAQAQRKPGLLGELRRIPPPGPVG